jgi:hypothetical protein
MLRGTRWENDDLKDPDCIPTPGGFMVVYSAW